MRAVYVGFFLICTFQLHANHVRVSRDAIIREQAVNSAAIIERVEAGTLLPLLDDEFFGTGYLKVRAPGGRVGYIYKSWVRIQQGDIPPTDSEAGPDTNTSTTIGGNLEIHMINVGQGDAIIIRCPDGQHEILIDAAELNAGFRYSQSLNEFKNYMAEYQPENNPIEVVVASHPHSDHIAGMSWVVAEYSIGLYVDNGMTNTSGTYNSLETKLGENNIKRARLNDSRVPNIDFCPRTDVNARILRPEGFDEPGMDPNDYSVIVRIDYGSTSFLFTGDAEKEMENKLVADDETASLLDVDFLKVGHHGSHSSSQKSFLDLVTPDIAVISSGAETIGTNARHRHPRMVSVKNLLPYLRDRNGVGTTIEAYDATARQWDQITTDAALFITNNDGDLIFYSDGREIWRKGNK